MADNDTYFQFAIDANEANVLNRVGSNVYAFQLLNAIELITRRRTNFRFKILLSSFPVHDLPPARTGWEYVVFGPKFMWTQWALPIYLWLNRHQIDAAFTPGHYAPRISSVPYISSVMDVSYLDFPDQFRDQDLIQLKDWTQYSVKNAHKIIAISQATRLSVARSYNRSLEDILIAYPAVDHWPTARRASNPHLPDFIGSELKKWLRLHSISTPYFLYLGTLQPRKNIRELIEGFEHFYQAEASSALHHSGSKRKGAANLKQSTRSSLVGSQNLSLPHLVIAGKVGWLAKDILARVNSSPLKGLIHLPGYVPEELKSPLIRQSSAVILLGEGEGFGIPPLEALSLGVPPIVANNASLPEVVGNAGWLVNPHQPQQIAQALSEIWNLSSTSRQSWWNLAKEQVKQFSWKKSALIIINALEEIAIDRKWKNKAK